MGTRHERVVVSLDENLSTGFANATAHAVALDRTLGKLDGSLTKLQGSNRSSAVALRTTERQVDSLAVATRRGVSDLDSYSKRLGLLSTAALALGPTILPVAAAGVPALGALATGMLATATASATLMLAFQGVGDAVSAVSDYELEPTAENLAKVEAALDAVGPSGAQFVLSLKEMQPVLRDLQMASRDGIFPGFERGLDAVVSKSPKVIAFVEDISRRVGDLGGDMGEALANDEDWREFFGFIATDAGPIMEDFGRSTGNFVAGVANVVEALSELSGGASGDLLESSRAFREWAAGMEDTEGFREFADYVRETGPDVVDFLGSAADASVELATALAPWGTAVLPILTAGADALAAIAGSPIGPPLATAAVSMLALSKASALLGPSLAKVETTAGNARSTITGLGRDVKSMSKEYGNLGRAHSAALSFMSGTTAAAQRTRGALAGVGQAAKESGPQLAAMTLLASGASEKMGLTNTAMLALAGSMVGPWGSAVGAGVGLTLDFAHANDSLKASIEGVNTAMDTNNLAQMSAAVEQLRADLKETTDSDTFGFDLGRVSEAQNVIAPLTNIPKWMGLITGTSGDAEDAIKEAEDAIKNYASSAQGAVGALNELTIAQQAQTQASLDGIDAGTAYGAALAAAAKQADTGAQGFDKFTEAGRANRTAMTTLIESYNAQDAATKNSVKGYRDAKREIAELGRGMGLTSERIRELQAGLDKPSILKVNTAQAQDAIAGARDALRDLPPEVQTHIATKGVPRTAAQVDALVAKYKLTEKQRTALMTLRDLASGPLGSILRQLLSLDGRTALITVYTDQVTRRRIIDYGVTKMKGLEPGSNARGGFYSGGVRAFADGGWGSDGRYYSREPMLVPGGKNILWGEKSTGWEAYISGKPGERDRNLEILAMAASRLGATVTPYATGGIPGRRDPVAAALWQSGHRDPRADLIAGMTVRQLARLGRAFDDLSGKRLTRFGRGLERAAKIQEKQTDRARDRFETVRDRRNEISSSIATGLRSDLWADTGGSAFSKSFAAGSIGGSTSLLNADTAKAKQFNKDIALLRKKGLNGAALQEIIGSGDADRARMFAAGSKAELQTYERAYNARQSATAAAGRLGGQVLTPEFNSLLREYERQRGQLQQINKNLAALRKEQDRRHDQAQKSRKDNGAGSAARRGARSR